MFFSSFSSTDVADGDGDGDGDDVFGSEGPNLSNFFFIAAWILASFLVADLVRGVLSNFRVGMLVEGQNEFKS